MATKSNDIDAAVCSLGLAIKDVSPQARDMVLNQLCSTEKICTRLTKVILGLTAEDGSIVCDRVLGLNDGTGSKIDDVFTCKIRYEAVITCVESGKVPNLCGSLFYEDYLAKVVDRIWGLLAKSMRRCHNKVFQTKKNIKYESEKGISQDSGLELFGLTRKKTVDMNYRIKWRTFEELYQCLKRLWQFIVRESTSKNHFYASVCPSKKLVTKFLHSDKPAGLVFCSSSTEHANNEEDSNEEYSRSPALIDNMNDIEQKSTSSSLHDTNNEEDISEQRSRSSPLIDDMNGIDQKSNSSPLHDKMSISSGSRSYVSAMDEESHLIDASTIEVDSSTGKLLQYYILLTKLDSCLLHFVMYSYRFNNASACRTK